MDRKILTLLVVVCVGAMAIKVVMMEVAGIIELWHRLRGR
jgi:hypothetical protein